MLLVESSVGWVYFTPLGAVWLTSRRRWRLSRVVVEVVMRSRRRLGMMIGVL